MINKVILIGRLGADPEVRHFDGGGVVANFRIATDESYTDRNGDRKEVTEWHNIAVWRKQAEVAEKYLRKGSMVYVEGKLKTRSYDDKDGNKRYVTEVVGDFFKMLDKKGSGDQGEGYQSSPEPAHSDSGQYEASNDAADDLPF